ncbi:MAG: YitT family protein [Clostridia bacterium]|nr:YitT family protein [Clostridia bacterium]
MEKLKTIDWKREGKVIARDYLLIVVGSMLLAFAFVSFFIPYDIAPGGVTGISTVISHLTGVSVGLLSFIINLPLFLAGWRQVGWRFAVRSFIAMMLVSLFLDTLPTVDLAGDALLGAGFGGVVMGVGLGLVVRAGASTGGTDMAAKMVHKLLGFLSIPVVLFAIDGLVVVVAAAVFGLKAALWALLSLYTSTIAMDAVIKGFDTAMQFVIITKNPDPIISRIHTELERGCTRLSATGTYSGESIGTLLCVISRVEVARLKKLIAEEDPLAFVTVCNVHEALGEGFSGMND